MARTGLAAHPNYPSARMTLGRALFDTGDLAAARGELELVLRGAPENILASRMLAECLEGLGDLGAALLQFRAALRLAPGDRQTEQQIRALEQRLAGAGGSRPVAAPRRPQSRRPLRPWHRRREPPRPLRPCPWHRPPVPTPPTPPPPPRFAATVPPLPPAPPPAPPRPAAAPDPAADFDDVFETAPSWQRASTPADVPAPEAILLLEDEAPTLPASPHPAPRPAEALAPPTEAPRPPQPPPPPVEFPRAAPPAAPPAPVPPAARSTCRRATGHAASPRGICRSTRHPGLCGAAPSSPPGPTHPGLRACPGDRAGLLLRGFGPGPGVRCRYAGGQARLLRAA